MLDSVSLTPGSTQTSRKSRRDDPWTGAAKQGDVLIIDPVILNLAVALGIGLLIGAERERRKGEGPSRSPAGIRTFTVASLSGAISLIVGGTTLLAVATAGVDHIDCGRVLAGA